MTLLGTRDFLSWSLAVRAPQPGDLDRVTAGDPDPLVFGPPMRWCRSCSVGQPAGEECRKCGQAVRDA